MQATLQKRPARKAADTFPKPDRSGVVSGLSTKGFHDIAFVEWAPEAGGVPTICVHGVSRQGRDFDALAARLAKLGHWVVCPDLPGRGRSDWLADADDYALPQYCADMNNVIARLGVDEVDWVGTSLGGLVGIILAGMPGSRIRRLVVNDIGPYVSSTGLMRIGDYLRQMPDSFSSLAEADAYYRRILAPYGDLTDAQWRHIAEFSVRWDKVRNVFVNLCDPGVQRGFRSAWFASLNIWKYWEEISAPTLVLHGAKSDLLTRELCDEMVDRNPNASVHRFEECGHVPPLFEPHQIKVVTDFLAGGRQAEGRRKAGD